MSSDPVWDIQSLRELLWSWRRFLVWNTVLVTLGALVLALVLRPWYLASTSLLPPQEDEVGFNASTMLRGLAIPGVRLPTQVSPAEVFVAILTSRSLLTQIADEFDLRTAYKQNKMEDTIKELRHHVNAQIGEDGLITLRVEDTSRDRAANIANRMVALLDEFNRQTRSSRGKRARIFIESRIHDTQSELASAEDSLRSFQLTHKSLLLSPEEAGAADFASRLLSERIDLQMRLSLASSYASPTSPEMQRLSLRAQELDEQIQKLPNQGLGMARLYREVKVQEQVFTLLMAQYEEAKIEEAKDVATVEVLDRAIPPERKARPHRGQIVMLAFAISVVLGVGYVVASDYLRRVARTA
jgi:tyrosine-protein kinase Etk/Wzc